MQRIVVGVIGALLLVLMAAPGFAQQLEGSPIVEVVPREVDRPLPAVGTGPPGIGTPRDETVVLGTPLARTGFGVFEGLVLGAGLLLVGSGAVLLARRRLKVDL